MKEYIDREAANVLFGSRLTITRCRNFVTAEDGGADDEND